MVVTQWSLPTLSDLFYRYDQGKNALDGQLSPKIDPKTASQKYSQALVQAEKEWSSAIASLEQLLSSYLNEAKQGYQGVFLSSPSPLLTNDQLISRLLTGVFNHEVFAQLSLSSLLLPPAENTERVINSQTTLQLPLLPKDPLNSERFALVFTEYFCLAIILGKDSFGFPKLHFSFVPELLQEIWSTLKTRLFLTNHKDLKLLEKNVDFFPPIQPNYQVVTQFSRFLLANLPKENKKKLYD